MRHLCDSVLYTGNNRDTAGACLRRAVTPVLVHTWGVKDRWSRKGLRNTVESQLKRALTCRLYVWIADVLLAFKAHRMLLRFPLPNCVRNIMDRFQLGVGCSP